MPMEIRNALASSPYVANAHVDLHRCNCTRCTNHRQGLRRGRGIQIPLASRPLRTSSTIAAAVRNPKSKHASKRGAMQHNRRRTDDKHLRTDCKCNKCGKKGHCLVPEPQMQMHSTDSMPATTWIGYQVSLAAPSVDRSVVLQRRRRHSAR